MRRTPGSPWRRWIAAHSGPMWAPARAACASNVSVLGGVRAGRSSGWIAWRPRTAWRQITAAIDAVEYLVLIMTKASLASSVVRDEWRYARLRGTCVIPVMSAADLDFGPLPGWMRRAHFVDPAVPEQWTRL